MLCGGHILQKIHAKISRDIYVEGIVHEECFEGIAARKASERVKVTPYIGISVVPDYCRTTYDRRLLVGEIKKI